MAMVRSWSVESKAIEMLIKGGYAGLRMVERSNKKQGSIYIQRDELKWLVGAIEEAVDVDTSVVYWNQSRAGYPRVLVQRRSNRHGRFIIMEEFEGRTRRGSVLIPEGRYGQGWTRLLSELKIARTTLWNGRVFRESKVGEKVSDKRTFAEVVSQPKMPEKVITGGREQQQTRPTFTEKLETEKCDGYAQHQSRPMNMKPSENLGVRALTHVQTRPEINLGKKQVQWGSSQETEVAGGHQGEPAKCVLHEALQNPAISGAAAQNGGWESERNGASSLHARAELQEILKCLTDIRGQVDLGLKRVELAIQFMEQGENMGREFMDRGRSSEVGGWAKPKKKKFKQMSKNQAGLLGSKPDKDSSPGRTSGPYPLRKSPVLGLIPTAGAADNAGRGVVEDGRRTSFWIHPGDERRFYLRRSF
jgi:hypothetical protein